MLILVALLLAMVLNLLLGIFLLQRTRHMPPQEWLKGEFQPLKLRVDELERKAELRDDAG